MNDVHIAAGREQNGLQRRAAHAVHRVQNDMQVTASDGIHIYATDDGVQVRILRVNLLHQSRRHGLIIGDDVDIFLGNAVGGFAQLVGHGLLRVAPALGEHLHAVVDRGVMAGRNCHAVVQTVILDREHDQRRGRFPADEQHMDSLPRQYLCRPLRRFTAQKPAVIADAEALVLYILRLHAQRQRPRKPLHIEFGKPIGDNGAPSARAK